jgi:hypothetical protein
VVLAVVVQDSTLTPGTIQAGLEQLIKVLLEVGEVQTEMTPVLELTARLEVEVELVQLVRTVQTLLQVLMVLPEALEFHLQ